VYARLSNKIQGRASLCMPTPSPIRDVLLAIGEAVRKELLRGLNENGRYPLRTNSALAKSLRVEVTQGRGASGRFEGYTANSALALYAADYAEYVDKGRKKFAKKIPISALLIFIKNRGLGQVRQKSGRFGGRTISANSLAFAIQTAIYKSGLRGRHFIQPAFDVGQNLVEIYLDNQLLDGLCYELDRTLKLA
jgi:hypothetical protein